MDFSQYLVNGVPLIFVIAGLVAFAKSMGLTGKGLTALSLLLGLVLGVLFQLAESGVPVDFKGWFSAVIFGVALGLTTSGLYDLVKRDFIGA